MKRKIRVLALLFAGMTAVCSAFAQPAVKYPTRPVRLLIPFAPGGSTDFVARIIQARMIEELGQSIVIDNRAGASGNIAVEIAAHAPPDGYTVLFGNIGTIAINPTLFREFPVDTVRDLQCVSMVSDVAGLLVVNAAVPVATFDEFVRYAKTRPGQLNFASPSAGSNGRLTMEFFSQKSGIQLTNVNYKGGNAVVAAVLSGETQVGLGPTPALLPLIKSGRLKVLALLGPARTPSLPDVPTLSEVGFPELTVSSWQGLYVPAKTPAPVVMKLRSAVIKAMADPKAIEALKTGGAGPMDPALQRDCTAFTRQQLQFWADVIRKIGLAGKQ